MSRAFVITGVFLFSFSALATSLTAYDTISCRSEKTGMNYFLDAQAGKVLVTTREFKIKSAEGLVFEPGQGEDIFLTVKTPQGDTVAMINGEEDELRGSFDHGLFESNLMDRDLRCVQGLIGRSAVMLNSRVDLSCASLACSKKDFVFLVGERVTVVATEGDLALVVRVVPGTKDEVLHGWVLKTDIAPEIR